MFQPASMHQSIPAEPSTPTPPPEYCGAFAHLVSAGGGAFANFVLLPHPRAIPKLLTHMQFPIRL